MMLRRYLNHRYLIVVWAALILTSRLAAEDGERVSDELQVLYTFEAPADSEGSLDSSTRSIVRDVSGNQDPIDLQIADLAAVEWDGNHLSLNSATSLKSQSSPSRLYDSLQASQQLTIEAWIKPSSVDQTGPARIVTLSRNTSLRNFTLGHDQNRFDFRLRTTSASTNGLPSVSSKAGTASTSLTHVVYTRMPDGQATLYVNGQVSQTGRVSGTFANWEANNLLILGNEATSDRPWLGEFHLVAIYSRALSANEVIQNYKAGDSVSAEQIRLMSLAHAEEMKARERANQFTFQIAPLLTRRCLECHDSVVKEGGLNLSRETSATTGGDSGPAIVPGDLEASILWEQIESDSMPPEGDPLSDEEKQSVRDWIENGAKWAEPVIDPAIYEGGTEPKEIFVQRLTVDEYIATVKAAVGVDIEQEARSLLPNDLRADGFSNTAYNLNVDLGHVEAYAQLARMIVDRMDVLAFASRFSKSRSLNTDASARKFTEAMGKWLFRGPLTRREEILYSGIATTVASAGGSFEDGVALTVEAMLQSPRFIYRIENQRYGGRVSSFELASRLSYIVWGGPPDEQLLKAAERGELSNKEQILRHVKRMLAEPSAIRRSEQFMADWLHLERLDNMQPDPERFPNWNRELAMAMKQESLAYFREIVWDQGRPLSDLLNAQFTFATPELAELYGLEPAGDGLQRYDLSEVPERGGLLTQGTLLTMGGDDASMVTRGLFILNDVLRGRVGDPPPGLDVTPVPSRPGMSQRAIAESRIKNESCGGCHSKFEPLSFGLEKFDGIGAFSEKDEHGNRLQENGEVFIPGSERPLEYENSAELMSILAESDRVRESITWKLTQFALGRPLGIRDAAVVRAIHEQGQAADGTYAGLIEAIVTSDLVLRQKLE